MSGDIFSCYHLVERGVNDIKWVEAKDAAKHPTICRTFSKTKDYLEVVQFLVCSILYCTVCLKSFFPTWSHISPDQNHVPFLF